MSWEEKRERKIRRQILLFIRLIKILFINSSQTKTYERTEAVM